MVSHMVWCNRKMCAGECNPSISRDFMEEINELKADNTWLLEQLEIVTGAFEKFVYITQRDENDAILIRVDSGMVRKAKEALAKIRGEK